MLPNAKGIQWSPDLPSPAAQKLSDRSLSLSSNKLTDIDLFIYRLIYQRLALIAIFLSAYRPKTYRWRGTDTWEDCQAACGLTGTQTRVYTCIAIGQDGRVSDVARRYCDVKKLEPESRACSGPPCPLQWSIGFWSQCSVTCGLGKRYRTVYCGDPDSDDDDYLCEESPPVTSKQCLMRACPNLKDENCRDMYSFCPGYSALRYRCKRSRFRRKCCQTCQDALKSAQGGKTSKRPKKMTWHSYR
ncbi:A disintegrin and metalloproteinase with thrombospondin motifs 2-like [Elysia marginata]|uniref:A disintegrin and metalloproteinase with thrombospondin motifs 2-like n=1 Tax=Elysia marginata TaxID=1093978 RepID=A0AAV4EGX2_9GAST|nr:A disintegrin and metalloproteinase with thrombospondin motifs 2-like [Elysia marginata]